MNFPKNLSKEFVVLSPEKQAFVELADASLYTRLDENYLNFRGHELIACHEFDADWSSWEMHPHGDEVVILMTGETTFILAKPEGEIRVELKQPGEYIIVPKGIWHTAKTQGQCKILFVTSGEGTQHKAVD